MIDIAIHDVTKEYELGQPVLDGLSFQVDTGERVGILGRNGAGKTTLLRILTGQETADSGTVSIAPGKRLGLISQIPVYPAGYRVEDVLRTAFDELKAMEAQLHALSDQLAQGIRPCWSGTTASRPPSRPGAATRSRPAWKRSARAWGWSAAFGKSSSRTSPAGRRPG